MFSQLKQFLWIGGIGCDARRDCSHAGIAWSADQLALWMLGRELPSQGVLTGAASNNEDLHAGLYESEYYRIRSNISDKCGFRRESVIAR